MSHTASGLWLEVFRKNSIEPSALPWEDDYHLTSIEMKAVRDSIRQFQLGEGSNGRGVLVRAFIAEEQRHSAHLGRFMSRQGIRPLESHWVDRKSVV